MSHLTWSVHEGHIYLNEQEGFPLDVVLKYLKDLNCYEIPNDLLEYNSEIIKGRNVEEI